MEGQILRLAIVAGIMLAVGLVTVVVYLLRAATGPERIEIDDHDTDLWRDLTDEHDLEFVSGSFSDDPRHLTGEYRGESVQVYERHRQDPETRQDISRHFIHYEIGLPAFVPDQMAIYDDRTVSNQTTMFEGGDLEVGRPELDEKFVVRGDDPEAIRSFLDRDAVASPLVALADEWDEFELEEGVLTVTEKSPLLDERTLDTLADFVERLREAGPPDGADSDGHVADLSET
jgi:hypothetical protein